MSWIRIENGFVTALSPNEKEGRIKVDLTEDQRDNIFNRKYKWDGEQLVLNPDWQEPLDSVKVDKQIEKREFGRRLLAEIEVELNVDEIMANNPSQGLALQQSLGGIIQSLNNGYLNTALIQINQIEPNQLITQEIINRYKSKIYSFE